MGDYFLQVHVYFYDKQKSQTGSSLRVQGGSYGQNRMKELLKSNGYLWPLKSLLLVTAVRYKIRKVSTGTSGAEMENSLKTVLQLPCMVMSL